MKMGKNDPRDSMSRSAKGRGVNGSQKNAMKGAAPGEVAAPGDKAPTNSGPSLGTKGRNIRPEPVADADSSKGLSGKAEVC